MVVRQLPIQLDHDDVGVVGLLDFAGFVFVVQSGQGFPLSLTAFGEVPETGKVRRHVVLRIIGYEEVELVLDDRATKGETVLLLVEGTAFEAQSVFFNEAVVTVVVEDLSPEIIGSRLRDGVEDTTGGVELQIVGGLDDLELLDRRLREGEGRTGSAALLTEEGTLAVGSVDVERVLNATSTHIEAATTTALGRISRNRARHQNSEVSEITALQRQIGNGLITNRRRNGRIGRLDDRRLCRYDNFLGHSAFGQNVVDPHRRTQADPRSTLDLGPETVQYRLDVIVPWGQQVQTIKTSGIRNSRPAEARIDVGRQDGRPRHGAAAVICCSTNNLSSRTTALGPTGLGCQHHHCSHHKS